MSEASMLFDIYENGNQTKQLVWDTAKDHALTQTDKESKTEFLMPDYSVFVVDSDGDAAAYSQDDYKCVFGDSQ